MTYQPLVLDSVTHLRPNDRGRAAHCASHGGIYAGYYAAKMGVGAVILNDAGIGREAAGLAGVKLLDQLRVPAATISHRSARIGDGADGAARGVLSFVNQTAADLGLDVGMACADAMTLLSKADLVPSPQPQSLAEARFEVPDAGCGDCRVVVMDSVSLIRSDDATNVIVAASHGGLLGGRAESAIKYSAVAAIFSDADRGIDDAGVSRLPALDERGVAGACVSAFSARIGDGRSLYENGYIASINQEAKRRGATIGMSCRDCVAALVASTIRNPQ
ncbi:MAG: hypothetical protein ACR2PG_27365 [Hyphomicrobiaceae bacterium]